MPSSRNAFLLLSHALAELKLGFIQGCIKTLAGATALEISKGFDATALEMYKYRCILIKMKARPGFHSRY